MRKKRIFGRALNFAGYKEKKSYWKDCQNYKLSYKSLKITHTGTRMDNSYDEHLDNGSEDMVDYHNEDDTEFFGDEEEFIEDDTTNLVDDYTENTNTLHEDEEDEEEVSNKTDKKRGRNVNSCKIKQSVSRKKRKKTIESHNRKIMKASEKYHTLRVVKIVETPEAPYTTSFYATSVVCNPTKVNRKPQLYSGFLPSYSPGIEYVVEVKDNKADLKKTAFEILNLQKYKRCLNCLDANVLISFLGDNVSSSLVNQIMRDFANKPTNRDQMKLNTVEMHDLFARHFHSLVWFYICSLHDIKSCGYDAYTLLHKEKKIIDYVDHIYLHGLQYMYEHMPPLDCFITHIQQVIDVMYDDVNYMEYIAYKFRTSVDGIREKLTDSIQSGALVIIKHIDMLEKAYINDIWAIEFPEVSYDIRNKLLSSGVHSFDQEVLKTNMRTGANYMQKVEYCCLKRVNTILELFSSYLKCREVESSMIKDRFDTLEMPASVIAYRSNCASEAMRLIDEKMINDDCIFMFLCPTRESVDVMIQETANEKSSKSLLKGINKYDYIVVCHTHLWTLENLYEALWPIIDPGRCKVGENIICKSMIFMGDIDKLIPREHAYSMVSEGNNIFEWLMNGLPTYHEMIPSHNKNPRQASDIFETIERFGRIHNSKPFIEFSNTLKLVDPGKFREVYLKCLTTDEDFHIVTDADIPYQNYKKILRGTADDSFTVGDKVSVDSSEDIDKVLSVTCNVMKNNSLSIDDKAFYRIRPPIKLYDDIKTSKSLYASNKFFYHSIRTDNTKMHNHTMCCFHRVIGSTYLGIHDVLWKTIEYIDKTKKIRSEVIIYLLSYKTDFRCIKMALAMTLRNIYFVGSYKELNDALLRYE